MKNIGISLEEIFYEYMKYMYEDSQKDKEYKRCN